MHELPQIAQDIEKLGAEIRTRLGKLDKYGKDIAKASNAYDLELGKTMAALEMGQIFTMSDGKHIKDLGASNRDKLAKAVLADNKLIENKILAETQYKGLISQIEGLKAVLNSKQSIWRHLSET